MSLLTIAARALRAAAERMRPKQRPKGYRRTVTNRVLAEKKEIERMRSLVKVDVRYQNIDFVKSKIEDLKTRIREGEENLNRLNDKSDTYYRRPLNETETKVIRLINIFKGELFVLEEHLTQLEKQPQPAVA